MFRHFFRRRDTEQVNDHALFGRIVFSRSHGWENDRFAFWGFTDVQLMIDAHATGPTEMQEQAFRRFLGSRGTLLPRFLAAVAEKRQDTGRPPGAAAARAISVPSLDADGPAGTSDLWTIWFDYEGDEHWTYGVQTNDDWTTVSAFAED